MENNFYKILGINKNSTVEEIKTAYREAVKQYHPDINECLDGENMIKTINYAYEQIMESKKNQIKESKKVDFLTIFSLSDEYKTSGIDFDVDCLDSNCIFIGDIYVVKYKRGYSFFDSFEESTELKLRMKDAVLLRIGFERYINLSKIKTSSDLKKIKKILKSNNLSERKSVTILGDFFKPFVGDKVVLNVKSYNELKNNQEPNVKRLKKNLIK